MTVDFAKLQEIFLAAVEHHRPEDWDAYVNQACAGDDELRRQVNLLLRPPRSWQRTRRSSERSGTDRCIPDRGRSFRRPHRPVQAPGADR